MSKAQAPGISKSDIQEGQKLTESELAQLGLTDAERSGIQSGKVNPQFVVKPGESENAIIKALDSRLAERIKEQAAQQRAIPPVKTIDQLTPEEAVQVESSMKKVQQSSFFIRQAVQKLSLEESPAARTFEPVKAVPETPASVRDIMTGSPNDLKIVADPEPMEEERDVELIPDVCPNCQWKADQNPSDIAAEDKSAYRRAIVTGQEFRKTYILMGGAMEIVFRPRSVSTARRIEEQLNQEVRSKQILHEPFNMAMIAYQIRSRRLQLATSIVSVTGYLHEVPGPGSKEWQDAFSPFIKDGYNDIAAAHDVLFKDWTEAVYNMIYKQFTVFEETCVRLVEAANSPDFWPEIAGAR